MLIFKLFFLPVIILLSGRTIENYDYKYYDTHSKYLSQNGMNLTFLKLSHDQWEYFLKILSKKYHTIFAIASLLFNLIIDFLIFPNQETMWLKFTFYLTGEIFTFFFMAHKTRKKIKNN